MWAAVLKPSLYQGVPQAFVLISQSLPVQRNITENLLEAEDFIF
jgi:hypothetical protein